MTSPFSAHRRPELLRALAERRFDLLVVGGGITGAGVARDAALRGLAVALVEKDDFASGTSSRSSRLVHGGLRYLEHGRLHLVFESSRERRTLHRIAPHLVRPLRFTWPLYEGARVAPWKQRAGLLLYDALALFRNIENHRTLDGEQLAAEEPALRQLGLRGGAAYYDAATDDARLTLATARAAAEAGAVVVNHAEVRELILEDDEVRGAVVADALDADEGAASIRVSAAVVVNATGPWSDAVRALAGDRGGARRVHGSKGVHVAVPHERLDNRGALTLLSPIDSRVFFILPAGPLSIIGTTETEYAGAPDVVRATLDDITYLLRCANAYFPAARLTISDVVSAWAGVRPLAEPSSSRRDGDAQSPDRMSREHAIAWSAPGLLSVTGGKLTTYRAMAAEVVDAAVRALGWRTPHRAATDRIALPGGDVDVGEELTLAQALVQSVPLAERLVHAYGSAWRQVWEMTTRDWSLATPIAPSLPYIAAELHYAVECEMALTLGDLLIRRLHVAFETRDHGQDAAPAAARVVAPLLGWTPERIDAELARYRRELERVFAVEVGERSTLRLTPGSVGVSERSDRDT